MALTDKHVRQVCDIYGGNSRCRYLEEDMHEDQNGNIQFIYVCRKKSPAKKSIDENVNKEIERLQNNNIPLQDSNYPMGDNCKGYVVLEVKPQGYDVP